MKKLSVILLAAATVSLPALAGEVYGTIKENGKAVKEGLPVTVACGDKTVSGATDKTGSYRVVPSQEGKCTLTVKVGGEAPSTVIHSYADSARYNLVLEKKGGTYALRAE